MTDDLTAAVARLLDQCPKVVRGELCCCYRIGADDDCPYQPAATPLRQTCDAQVGTASAVTDGPAADPIADLCAELRATHCSNENLHDNAAYELERLARTERLLQACVRHETARAERAEAERDALRECVRAADAMALECRRVGLISSTWLEDYDDASAKVKP